MTDRVRLEAFAEDVRRQAHSIITRCMDVSPRSIEKAMEIAGALCTQAANVKNGLQMEQEVAVGNYDLTALPAPSGGMEPE
jgi:hypothetical protein